MNKVKLSIAILFSLFSTLSAVEVNDYIGVWSIKKGSKEISVELKKDGSCLTGERGKTRSGKWTESADKSLIIHIDDVTSEHYKVEITEDHKLKLTEVKNKSKKTRSLLLEKKK